MIETLFYHIIQVIEKWIVVSALISFAYLIQYIKAEAFNQVLPR